MSTTSGVSNQPRRERVLYVSSRSEQHCGVYQFGKNIGLALAKSTRYDFIAVDCAGRDDLNRSLAEYRPAAVVYNYHAGTLSWIDSSVTRTVAVPQIGTIHECSQATVDAATNDVFDAHIAPDPTLLLRNPFVFKTGRLVLPYVNNHPLPDIPTIGSFGFGLEGKGFDRIIETVQREFDRALIRLHIPFSPIMDPMGTLAADIRRRCEGLITKPGVQLTLSHDFLDQAALLDFLAGNTVNAFFYDKYPDRGISSATDYALAVDRPMALTRSDMFRHFIPSNPAVFIEENTLQEIIARGSAALEPLRREWSEGNLIWEYERIVSRLLASPPPAPFRRRHPLLGKGRSALRRLRQFATRSAPAHASAAWVRPDTEGLVGRAPKSSEIYRACVDREGQPLNRILDNEARRQYDPATRELFRLVPEMLARKIPEANIQQAFVLDTVHRLATANADPSMHTRLLCVGSYEDSAAASLKRLGYQFDEIDPVLNYDLSEFCSRPTTVRASYDIIFSTSVIEHVPDDEQFLIDLVSLLAPGGTAVLTCDYQDQYRAGDPKPTPDFRLYTQRDFTERMLPRVPDCVLVDLPQWDCPTPDFVHEGCRYTFATLVFRKSK